MYFGDESRHLESVTDKAAGVVLPNVGLAQASDSVSAGSEQCQVQRLVLLGLMSLLIRIIPWER